MTRRAGSPTTGEHVGAGEPGEPGEPGDPGWTIAQIAQEFDVTHRTVRHYEELGLVSPERCGTRRVFHRRDRTRLALVLRGRRLGFPLEEIRTIIDLYDAPSGEAGQLTYLLDQIDDRRVELERRRKDIEDSLGELDELDLRCRRDLHLLERATRPTR